MEKSESRPVVGAHYLQYDGKRFVRVEAVEEDTVRWRDELGPGRSRMESFLRLYPTLAPTRSEERRVGKECA